MEVAHIQNEQVTSISNLGNCAENPQNDADLHPVPFCIDPQ